MEKQDFYIGWQKKMPKTYQKQIRPFVIGLSIIIPLLGLGLVMSQRGFLPSVFEFGQERSVEGWLLKEPVPMISIKAGRDRDGNLVRQDLLLVGFGKTGAEATIESMEKEAGGDLNRRHVKLKGTLFYYDGCGALELTSGKDALEQLFDDYMPGTAPLEKKEKQAVFGEIADPKCFFGVMKPGFGKPHRACAINCINGGVPPILRSHSKEGQTNYYIVLDANGKPVNKEILPYVGDYVRLCGVGHRRNNWDYIFLEPEEGLLSITTTSFKKLPRCK